MSYVNISAGKLCVIDYFDKNRYSDDPRTKFLNWALMTNGAWDYPANTRGYTWGLVAELCNTPVGAARVDRDGTNRSEPIRYGHEPQPGTF